MYGSSYTLQCNTSEEHLSVVEWSTGNGTHLSHGPYHIRNVSLRDEGEYVCEVFLDLADSGMDKPVSLYVVGQ